MRQIVAMLTLALVTMAGSCGGGNSKPNNVNGNWTATLTGDPKSPSFAFTTSLFQNSDNSVSATNLTFTTTTPCFSGSATAKGGFTLSGNFSGSTSGSLALEVQSDATASNDLHLTGTVVNNTVTGTWTLTGSTGCTGNGTFTMAR